MAKCDPVTYQGITPEVFGGLKKELESNGFSIQGTSGVINGPFGIVMEYEWNEGAGTLYTQVIDKSFFVPCSQIYEQLNKAINRFTV